MPWVIQVYFCHSKANTCLDAVGAKASCRQCQWMACVVSELSNQWHRLAFLWGATGLSLDLLLSLAGPNNPDPQSTTRKTLSRKKPAGPRLLCAETPSCITMQQHIYYSSLNLHALACQDWVTPQRSYTANIQSRFLELGLPLCLHA